MRHPYGHDVVGPIRHFRNAPNGANDGLNLAAVHLSATVGMQQVAREIGELSIMRARLAIPGLPARRVPGLGLLVLGLLALGLLALGGCAGDVPIEQPSMYFNMAEGARLDSQGAATMISLYRKNNGLPGVVIDPELMKVAEGQSQAMASRNKLDHDVKAPLPKRLQAAGYPATLAVENVSAGYHTLAEAFSGWRDSPPHRANMLQSGVTKMGIAASYAPNTKYKVFWTLILASTEPRDSSGIRLPAALLAN
jgi:cysteine-rich secretory family protein